MSDESPTTGPIKESPTAICPGAPLRVNLSGLRLGQQVTLTLTGYPQPWLTLSPLLVDLPRRQAN